MRFNQVATLITFASLGMVHAQHAGHPEMDSSLSTKQVGFVSWPYFFNQWVDSQAIGDAPANYNENVHACYLKLEVQQPFPDLDERWAVVGLQNCPPALIDHFLLTLTFPEQTGVILTDNYLHEAQVSQSQIQKAELRNVDAASHDHLAFWLPEEYATSTLALDAFSYIYEIRYPTPAPSVSTKYDVQLLTADSWYNMPPDGTQNGDFYQTPEYGPIRPDIADYPSYREKTITLPVEWIDACPGDFYQSHGYVKQSRMSLFYLRWTWTCPGHPVSETTTLEFGRSGHEAYDNSLPHDPAVITTPVSDEEHAIAKPETSWNMTLQFGVDLVEPREFASSISHLYFTIDNAASLRFNQQPHPVTVHIATGRDQASLRYYNDIPAANVFCGFYLWEQYYQTYAIDPFYYAPHENAPLGWLEPMLCIKK